MVVDAVAPALADVTSPAADTAAIAVSADSQFAVFVRFAVVLFE
jgi:hypothetical protein